MGVNAWLHHAPSLVVDEWTQCVEQSSAEFSKVLLFVEYEIVSSHTILCG